MDPGTILARFPPVFGETVVSEPRPDRLSLVGYQGTVRALAKEGYAGSEVEPAEGVACWATYVASWVLAVIRSRSLTML